MSGARVPRLASAVVAGAVTGFLAVAGLRVAPPAEAFWTDAATVTSGTFTTWALTNVTCPDPPFGTNHTVSWSAPAGTSVTTSITSTQNPVDGLSFWQTPLMPTSPQTTTGTSQQWGVGTNNPFETGNFGGAWQIVATPPAPSGGWTATRSGTWAIDYSTPLIGTTDCTVNP
jgi:hypothetical protein